MPTDQQILIMCDIAASRGAGLRADHRQDLVELVCAGYIERKAGMAGLYKLTGKGQKTLDERGVGATRHKIAAD